MAVQRNSDDPTPLEPTAHAAADEPSAQRADAETEPSSAQDSPHHLSDPVEMGALVNPVDLEAYLMTMECLKFYRAEFLRVLKSLKRQKGFVGFEDEEDDIYQNVCLTVANWKSRIILDSDSVTPVEPEEFAHASPKVAPPTDHELLARWQQLRPDLVNSPESVTRLVSQYFPLVVRMLEHAIVDRQRYLLADCRDVRRNEAGDERLDNLANLSRPTTPELDTNELLRYLESRAPELLSPLLQRVRLLRKEGVGWEAIGQQVDRHPDAIRKLYRDEVARLIQQIL